MEKLNFKNSLGLNLVGYLQHTNPQKIIILCHGFTGDKSERGKFDKVATALYKAGFSVFRFDFSGCGESDDAPILINTEVEDLNTVLQLIRSKGYAQLGLLGYSLGGLVSLKVKDPAIKSRVLWAPVTNKKEYYEQKFTQEQQLQLKNHGHFILNRPRKWRTKWHIPQQMILDRSNINQKQLLSGIMEPTLIIHGSFDKGIPIKDSKKAISFLTNSKLVEVQDDHYFLNKIDQVVEKTVEWFLETIP